MLSTIILTATIFRNYLTPSLIISFIKNNSLGTTQLLVSQGYKFHRPHLKQSNPGH